MPCSSELYKKYGTLWERVGALSILPSRSARQKKVKRQWLREVAKISKKKLEATGEDFSVEPAESRSPFRALLDVGLLRTTTNGRVFSALKGALDGGLDIPHSEKCFAGFDKEGKNLDSEVHRKYIYGGHVATYMRTLTEDEPEKYQTHFSDYIKVGIDADIEELYKKVHAAIRADPSVKKSEKQPPKEHKSYKRFYSDSKSRSVQHDSD